MTQLFVVKSVAFQELNSGGGVVFSTNGTWDGGYWDSKNYDNLQGTVRANASGLLTINQGQQSGKWDWTDTLRVTSGNTGMVTVPVVGKHVNITFATASGQTPTSGEFRVGLWGKHSDVLSQISGQTVKLELADSIRARVPLIVTAASGGMFLLSGDTKSAVIKASASNSSDIYIGGSGEPPYSGLGYQMEPGDTLPINGISNFNLVKAAAVISGDTISYLGITG